MTKKRDGIPKKLRFEIFKRDAFTCQYCGLRAPDVVLHCDHVTPVASGGETTLLNLITSCEGCNLGKGAVALSDQTTLSKKHTQAAALNERREQIEMMAEWHRGLSDIDGQSLATAHQALTRATNYELTATGIQSMRKWIREHGLAAVLDAIRIVDKYLDRDENGLVSRASFNLAFNKIGGVCYINKQKESDPLIARWHYLKGIVRNKWPNFHTYEYINNPVRRLLALGVDMEDIISEMKGFRSVSVCIRELDDWVVKVEEATNG